MAFEPTATNLVSSQSDSNGAADIFLFQRATGAVTLVSRAAGTTATAGSGQAFGRRSAPTARVAFESTAKNLVAGMLDPKAIGTPDVFLYNRVTGATSLVSHATVNATTAGNNLARNPSISGDGGFVAFDSYAITLVSGPTRRYGDVFLYARSNGAVTLLSHTAASATTTSNGDSNLPHISANGAFVVTTHATTRVSINPTVSADGAFMAFVSSAGNLVPDQAGSNGGGDVFLYSRASGSVTLVSHRATLTTGTGNGVAVAPSINGDGSVVAFQSTVTDLVAGQTDTNSGNDVFRFARATGEVTLVSHVPASPTTIATGGASAPSISRRGTIVGFQSTATNLVAGQTDGNASGDVFVSAGGASAPRRPVADFDADGDTEISVFRPSANTWYIRNGATVPFGAGGDIPVPCDYDGNGTADVAVFRPSAGAWLINGQPTAFLEMSGDVPVPGDYNGNGVADMGVFRPSGRRLICERPDHPIPWAEHGRARPRRLRRQRVVERTVFRPASEAWYVGATAPVFFGLNGDRPQPLPSAVRQVLFP